MHVSFAGVSGFMQKQGLPMKHEGFLMEFRCRQMEGLWGCLDCAGIRRVGVSHMLSLLVVGVV
jgi:hypothetical protein